jgi:hypothetical protein
MILTLPTKDALDDLLAKRVATDQVLRKEEEALFAQKADHAQLKEAVASLQRTKAATTDEIRELQDAVTASVGALAQVRYVFQRTTATTQYHAHHRTLNLK